MPEPTDSRGVSEVLGYVLVFSLVVSTVAVVSVSGLATLDDVKRSEQLDNGERAFDILADNVADVYRRGAPSRGTEVSVGEATLYTGEPTTVNVTVDGAHVLNRTSTPIVYRNERDQRLVYNMGAVFRTNPDSGILVREPSHVVRNERLLLNVVVLHASNQTSVGGSTALVRTLNDGSAVRYSDTGGAASNVSIRIESERASLWEDYFDRRGFDCSSSPPSPTEMRCEYPVSGSVERTYVVSHDVRVDIER
ncbi:DUF7289 family protein [Haloarcula nitratireducens]|uniref:Flagellin n=1 Tax=Haloarcula nitratireducens TaxID=2487749 RepID=A0AAW4P9Z7_9EURY|nr:hypothetical protein [Halomicroarcula nitratireducens]MBX0294694.1 hypothetical protein [Halomicroarcula nitratireducens]